MYCVLGRQKRRAPKFSLFFLYVCLRYGGTISYSLSSSTFSPFPPLTLRTPTCDLLQMMQTSISSWRAIAAPTPKVCHSFQYYRSPHVSFFIPLNISAHVSLHSLSFSLSLFSSPLSFSLSHYLSLSALQCFRQRHHGPSRVEIHAL